MGKEQKRRGTGREEIKNKRGRAHVEEKERAERKDTCREERGINVDSKDEGREKEGGET